MATDWDTILNKRPSCHCATENMKEVDHRALFISKTIVDGMGTLGNHFNLCDDVSGYVLITAIATLLRAFSLRDIAPEYEGSGADLTNDQRMEIVKRSQPYFETLVSHLAKEVLRRDTEICAMVERDGGMVS